MPDDLPRVCSTCHYCRMDTDAESIALYGRVLGYGTCYRESGGWTVKAPGEQSCDRWWSPLEATPATTREEGDEHADR